MWPFARRARGAAARHRLEVLLRLSRRRGTRPPISRSSRSISQHVGADAAVWEHVVRKLRAGMMPPHDGGPRPTAEQTTAVSSLGSKASSIAPAAESPDPGPHRAVPPPEPQRVPQRRARSARDRRRRRCAVARRRRELRLRQHRRRAQAFADAARALSRAPPTRSAGSRSARHSPFVNFDSFRIPDDRSQERRLPGMPFGTRGGIVIDYTFPQDGDYDVLGGARARLERRHAGLHRGAGARDQHRSRARRDCSRSTPRRRCRRRRIRRPTTSASESTSGAPLAPEEQQRAQSRRRGLDCARAREGGPPRGHGHVPRQSRVARRTEARSRSCGRSRAG